MNLRISALLLAALLAGCGFTDATNQTGTAFLATQGISISARDSFRTTVPVLGVQVVPVEGIPAPNGVEALWLGGTLNDSIRAVVAFDLTNTTAPDAGFKSIQAVDSLASKYELTRLSFGVGSGGDTDTTTPRQVRVRFILMDSTSQNTGNLPALFMGTEPSALGLTPIVDRDSSFVPSMNMGIPFGPALRDSVAARLKAAKPTWLVAILDGHPGWQAVFSVGDPRLRTDSVSGFAAGSFLPGLFQARTAWRSTEMRSAAAWGNSLGWWVGGGNRLRVTLDGNALRTLLHQRLGTGIPLSDSFDNNFNVLQARVRVPFSGFHWLQGASADNRSLGIDGAVVLDTGSSNGPSAADMPIRIDHYLMELGLTVDPYLQFDDSFPNILQCRYFQERTLADVPTRLSLGMGSSASYTSTNFWLRKDVPDSMEFRISGQVRVRVSHYPNDPNIHMHWSLLGNSPIADPQIGIGDTARPESRVSDTTLSNTTSPIVHQEARTSFSLSVLYRKASVDVDLVPAGGTIGMQDLWEADPGAANIMDSLGLVVRPRAGSVN